MQKTVIYTMEIIGSYNIKTILDQIGMSNIWENQLNITVDYNRIKQRILDIYQQTWYSSINNSPRLRFYSLFKHSFNFESYLDIIKDKKNQNFTYTIPSILS